MSLHVQGSSFISFRRGSPPILAKFVVITSVRELDFRYSTFLMYVDPFHFNFQNLFAYYLKYVEHRSYKYCFKETKIAVIIARITILRK